MSRRRLALAGGLLALVGGTGHLVATVAMRRDAWAQMVDEGLINTVSLMPSVDRLALSEAFWLSPGSFGAPLLLLGALVTWLSRHGQPVPWWLGGGMLVWVAVIGLISGVDSAR